MPELEVMRGPALDSVQFGDDEAIRHLAREQRARLATIREQRIWNWFGGIFAGQPSLWPFFSSFVFLAIVPVAVIVAGITQGWWLVALVVIAAASIAPYVFLFVPRRRRAQRLFETAELRPAIVLTADPELEDPEAARAGSVQVLVGPPLDGAEALQCLVAAADRVRSALDASSDDEAVAAVVDELRRRQGRTDGSRVPVAQLGFPCEIASLRVFVDLLPGGCLESRLMFVLAAPDRRDAGSTLQVQTELWGEGVDGLWESLPWRRSA